MDHEEHKIVHIAEALSVLAGGGIDPLLLLWLSPQPIGSFGETSKNARMIIEALSPGAKILDNIFKNVLDFVPHISV